MTSPEKLATPEINHASAETAKVLEQAIGALADILGGWRYIRQFHGDLYGVHGDLYGVGWDRCEAGRQNPRTLTSCRPHPLLMVE